MSDGANVSRIEALGELQGAMNRYQTEATESLLAVEIEIHRTREWLQRVRNDWQNELRRREEFLKQAQEALRSCEAQARYDPETGRTYVPDCSRQQAIVRQAQRLVEEARYELENVEHHMRNVEGAVSTYQSHANRLKGALNKELIQGTTRLGNSQGILNAYTGGAIGGGIGTTVSSGSGDSGNFGGSTLPNQVQDMVQSIPAFIPSAGKIGNTGMQMVPVTDIDLSDSYVKGPNDFKKGVSLDQMKEGLLKLQSVVLPALARGENRDFIAELDAAQGLENADTYSNIYDVYFRPEVCIHLERSDGKLRVINGFHRLLAAQQMGLTHIPAMID